MTDVNGEAAARDAIERLVHRYCRLQDAGDWDGYARLFEHGAFQATDGEQWRGAELAVRRRANIVLAPDGTPGTKTVTTNVQIAVSDALGRAEARSYFTMLRPGTEGGIEFVGAGRYFDRFERAGGEWRFAHRRAFLDLRGGIDHMRRVAAKQTAGVEGPPTARSLPLLPAPADASSAIEALLYRYAERMDLGDFDGVGELFARAPFSGGRIQTPGGPALTAALRAIVPLHDGEPRTKHVITNPQIELDEDAGTASARSYFTVLQAAPGMPLHVSRSGRYIDAFAVEDGAWRFASRTALTDAVRPATPPAARR
jgi:3-phenylpropionate/cinnamic acid dioxygenase small subunit